ncbi:uncharacterized protein TRIADDRAFT_53538 [Trichoplax adhaerens]|uniref:Ion transport domain-containing protein n=1 Tax=Trichoplax adhaerens TaxID=10228 RepID=B3RPG9_TRIAD|nr:hypothetical protein TRIADDRAFT_53538 [Trichoplax adhaerens]EDV27635.1 hypothetical protein TRIADDRAFT_53538 [Trichoplax adhaerens]|eukprot:XP_002109469.1 hypothetical protein TRIADDRAFT_53538 [Trichoplax adhaerens]
MDKYITKIPISTSDSKSVISVEYDFTILDPGIEFEDTHNFPNGTGSFNALKTIVSSKHNRLLEHPLPAKLLDTKWSRFGRHVYWSNLAVYISFVFAFSVYVIEVTRYKQSLFPEVKFIGFERNSSVSTVKPSTIPSTVNHTTHNPINTTTIDVVLQEKIPLLIFLRMWIGIFSGINILREIFQLYQERLNYYLNRENYVELALHIIVLLFITNSNLNGYFWCIGSLAIQLSFMDLVLFLRKLPYIGKYVVMMRSVAITALKVTIIAVILMVGFAISFGMLCNQQAAFHTFGLSFTKVVDMTVGEIDYDTLLSGISTGVITYPNSYVLILVLMVFIFLMPILIINLMIGLAVDDIAEIEKAAALQRLADLTEFFYNIERAVPTYFRRFFALDKITCMETKRNGNMIKEDKKDLIQDRINFIRDINDKLESQDLK